MPNGLYLPTKQPWGSPSDFLISPIYHHPLILWGWIYYVLWVYLEIYMNFRNYYFLRPMSDIISLWNWYTIKFIHFLETILFFMHIMCIMRQIPNCSMLEPSFDFQISNDILYLCFLLSFLTRNVVAIFCSLFEIKWQCPRFILMAKTKRSNTHQYQFKFKLFTKS